MRRKSAARTFKNWLIYRTLVAASAAGRSLSLPRARAVGRKLGDLAHRLVRKERERALRNVAFAFPEKSDEEHRRIVREMFRHLGTCLLEICWLPNLTPEIVPKTTIYGEGFDRFLELHKQKKGIVLFTGHCGNWEWMADSVGTLGYEISVVAREIYDSRLNDFIVQSRARHNIKTIGRGSLHAAREILQSLRGGGVLGVLIDQNIKAESALVPFFGRPAPTPIGPAKLAIRAGAMAVSAFIERRGDMQYVRFGQFVETSRDDDPVELTARMTADIEEQIRRVPEQWVWMHKRW